MTNATQHILTTGRAITFLNVQAKGWTRGGIKHQGEVLAGQHVSVTPKASVRLHGVISNSCTRNGESVDTTFAIGDQAIYGGFNLTYFGEIVAIGAKSVSIRENHGGQVHRLDLAAFSRENHGRDFDVIRKRNSEWLD